MRLDELTDCLVVDYFLLCHFIIIFGEEKGRILGGMGRITRVQTKTNMERSNPDMRSSLDKQSDLEQGFKEDTIKGGIEG